MNVPFSDLKPDKTIKKRIMNKISEMIDNTDFIGGKEIIRFEEEFSKYSNVKYTSGCSNGTDAIILALKALNIGLKDKVILPVNTFIATAEAVAAVGAEPVFCDIEEDYYTIDPEKLENILKKTKCKYKAVIPVHIYGQMSDMPKINEIAGKYDLKIIEDSAQSHLASINGKMPGYYGDIATYSFYPGKNLGAYGDAGAVCTNNKKLDEKIKMLRNHGRRNSKYEHEILGYNKRMDSIQAAILRIKLEYLNQYTDFRIKKAGLYLKTLKNKNTILPKIRKNSVHVFHLFVIRVKSRENLIKTFKSNGINYGIHYPIPLHKQKAFRHLMLQNDFPVAERVSKEIMSLPLWHKISSKQISYVGSLMD